MPADDGTTRLQSCLKINAQSPETQHLVPELKQQPNPKLQLAEAEHDCSNDAENWLSWPMDKQLSRVINVRM